MNNTLDPSHIMQTATAFWPSKVLLTAVELDLFSVLGEGAMTASELMETLELHPRGTYDFFDALVALKFLEPETAAFLDKKSPTYIGGMPEMLNARLFGFWNHLGTALKTGKPQSEIKVNGRSFFEGLYTDEVRLRKFMTAMNGFQAGNFHALAEKFDFSKYQTVSDIGGALALFSRIVGAHHQHLTFTTFDLPPVAPLAQEQIDATGMSERITVVSGDFFVDDLPKADVVVMGNILHDWNLEKKKILIQKAYDALPEGGAYIVIENLIDDARRENAFGLLMSLNMLIELGDGFDYTGADFRQWCSSEVGFKRFELIPLTGPSSAGIAYK
jgi:hypothetical protein